MAAVFGVHVRAPDVWKLLKLPVGSVDVRVGCWASSLILKEY